MDQQGLLGTGDSLPKAPPPQGGGKGGLERTGKKGSLKNKHLPGTSSLPSLVLGGLTYATSLMLIESFEIISAIIPHPMEMRKQRFRDIRRKILFGAV